jgi:surface antigen
MVLLSLLLFLSGCQTSGRNPLQTEADQVLLSKTRLPDYVPGEYFVYDDGTSVLVSSVSDGMVTWKHHNGVTSTGYPNFIIPDLTWSSANRSSAGRTAARPDLLWPPTAGKREQFAFAQTITHKDGRAPEQIDRNWTCTVEGTTRVAVPAGEFNTIVIACRRFSTTSGSWRGTRRFYYAPEVGHYVIREDQHRRRANTRRELVAHGFNSTVLPQRDQVKLNQTLQAALSKNGDGRASFWRSKSGYISAMLVPVTSYTGSGNQSCREYRSVYSVRGRIREHGRNVCRQTDGSWQRVD